MEPVTECTADASEPMNCDELLSRHAELWQAATHHPFLDGVRDGSLPSAAFEAWLVQDCHFVAAAVRFQAQVLSAAPRGDQRVLVEGLGALIDELDWFEAHASERRLSLGVALQPACRAYGDFLLTVARESYAPAITTVWAVERAYFEAWSGVRPGAPAYREYVEHWTAEGFAAYVDALSGAAERALAEADPADQRAAEDAFVRTARCERDFWQMAFITTPSTRGSRLA